MHDFELVFPQHEVIVRAVLLRDKAPVTTKAFMNVIGTPVEIVCRHAIFTGHEISLQLPPSLCTDTPLQGVPPENLTCFPAAGDLLFTYMPEYAWAGISSSIFDVGCFYQADGRTFFPAGWIPGNLFAKIAPPDVSVLNDVGNLCIRKGEQVVRIQRAD